MTGGFAGTVAAKDTRAAIAVSVEGTVMVTKAGGSNEYRAYADMSLNQGDHIRTESGSSIVLRVVDQEDEVTVGPDTELYISSLMETDGAKKSKFKMWAGSVWFKVKKLVNADDEFELETSTAVMGVRGSNGYIQAKLGELFAMMASGVLATEKKSGSEDSTSSTASIYPGQQINLSGSSDIDPSEAVSGLDIESFVQNASPGVIEKFLTTLQEIREENEQFVQDVNTGSKQVDSKSGLQLGNPADLSKFGNNLTALLANVAKTAADTNKLDKTTVQSLIDKANQSTTGQKIDLNNVPKFDKTAGMDPEVAKKREETAKQQQSQSQQERDRAAKELEDKQKENVALLRLLEAAQKAFEQANRKAKEEAAKNAEDAFKNSLSDAQKQQFEQNKQKAEDEKKKQEQQQQNNTSSTPTPNPNTNPGNTGNNGNTGGDTGSGNEPDPVAPTKPTFSTANIQTLTNKPTLSLTVSAQVGATVQVWAGSEARESVTIGSSGSSSLQIQLREGINQLSLTARLNGLESERAILPGIMLDTSAPTGSISVSGGNTVTSNVVTLNIDASSDTTKMSLSQVSGSFDEFVNFSPTVTNYQLTSGTGPKTIYVKLQDGAGNVSTQEISVTVTVVNPDTGGPAKATFTVTPSTISKSTNEFSIVPGQQFYIDVELSQFTGESSLYAVEARLNYDLPIYSWYSSGTYGTYGTYGTHETSGTSGIYGNPGYQGNEIFNTSSSVARLEQAYDVEIHKNVLLYLISNYSDGRTAVDNIDISGTKRLVRFTFSSIPYVPEEQNGTITLNLRIVDKNGRIVNPGSIYEDSSINFSIQNGGIS
ncbi:hypothetical protein [Paenibacillus sp. HJGM_3]|uniref:hypothetical protein n=1 Tax=Paenibacillus sp. HJGM_3 TaxID=3379816 RepID=UPI00386D1410